MLHQATEVKSLRPDLGNLLFPKQGGDICPFASFGRHVAFKRHAIIFSSGSACHGLYRIERGLIALRHHHGDGRRAIVRLGRPGDIVEWSGALVGSRHRYEGWALCDGDYCYLPVEEWCRDNPSQVQQWAMMAAYRENLLLEESVARLSVLNSEERLLTFLLSLVDERQLDRFPISIRVPVQKNEIAEIISVTPESCSRTLTKLQKQGVIEWKDREKMLILDKTVKHLVPFIKFFR
ncbi:MAG: Crp/Fnr family transcriptional regulator [Rhodospirillales bacterium]|jgi:CRP-like cAMP-binding protein|nr:Crp/Fnr family transcriptional regulator [Rhodospirillales bacterium]MDK9720122.1 Crp/Fnr family transcriptional regulator [Rhodospirillales bacterium]